MLISATPLSFLLLIKKTSKTPYTVPFPVEMTSSSPLSVAGKLIGWGLAGSEVGSCSGVSEGDSLQSGEGMSDGGAAMVI